MELSKRIEIVPWGYPLASTSSGTFRQQSGSALSGANVCAAATLNEYTKYSVLLSAGTWTLTLIYVRGTNCGQTAVTIGGTAIGTVEHYNGSSAINQVVEYSGIVIAETNHYELKFQCSGKHVSSSNYFCQFHYITLRRTA